MMRESRSGSLLTICVLAMTSAAAHAAESLQPPTAERLVAVRHLEDLQLSPKRDELAVTVAEVPVGIEPRSHIWLYSLASGKWRKFTDSPRSETRARWSPDGRKLAFLSDRGDTQQ